MIATLMERSLRVLQHENPKISFSFQKWLKLNHLNSDLCLNHPSFVNVSLTVVIDTRVLTSWEPKNLVFLQSFFVNNLARAVQIDWCYQPIMPSISIQVGFGGKGPRGSHFVARGS